MKTIKWDPRKRKLLPKLEFWGNDGDDIIPRQHFGEAAGYAFDAGMPGDTITVDGFVPYDEEEDEEEDEGSVGVMHVVRVEFEYDAYASWEADGFPEPE